MRSNCSLTTSCTVQQAQLSGQAKWIFRLSNWYMKLIKLADTVTCFKTVVRTTQLTCSHHTNGEGGKIKLVQRRWKTYGLTLSNQFLYYCQKPLLRQNIGKTTDSTLRKKEIATVGLLLCWDTIQPQYLSPWHTYFSRQNYNKKVTKSHD